MSLLRARTWSRPFESAVAPIPTFPLESTSNEVPDELPTANSAPVPVLCTESRANGDELPTPTFPVAKKFPITVEDACDTNPLL